MYVYVGLKAVRETLYLLNGRENPRTTLPPAMFNVMCRYCGNTTITQSPLVVTYLHNSTASLNGTVYLEENGTTFTQCAGIPEHKKVMYSNAFLRSLYDAITIGVDYAEPDYGRSSLELIAPVIDCTDITLPLLHANRGRFNFIVRRRNESDRVFILLLSLSNQEYIMPDQGESGPAAVAVLRFFDNMQAKTVWNRELISRGYPFYPLDFRAVDIINTTTTGLWTTRTIPMDADEEPTYIQTAQRIGFYQKAETEQSNINYQTRLFEQNPCWIFTRWRYTSQPVLKDSWAWVHFIHLLFAASMIANLIILFTATFFSIRAGTLWIGDAFLSFYQEQLYRGLLVMLSWYINGFWTVREFSQHDGRIIADLERVLIYDGPIHADLLTLFLSICAVVGLLLRERIDPIVAMVCFEIGFSCRLSMLNWLPASSLQYIKDYTFKTYVGGEMGPSSVKVSPMNTWTFSMVDKHDFKFIMCCLAPMLIMLSPVVAYSIVRKVIRVLRGRRAQGTYEVADKVASADSMVQFKDKQVLTRFEIATGVDVGAGYGVLCAFKGSVVINDAKYVTSDGVYSNGFVIANRKFLMQMRDVWAILFMKIIRKRYTTIYIYKIDGSTVHQTARLVYPDTLTMKDLLHLSVQVLV